MYYCCLLVFAMAEFRLSWIGCHLNCKPFCWQCFRSCIRKQFALFVLGQFVCAIWGQELLTTQWINHNIVSNIRGLLKQKKKAFKEGDGQELSPAQGLPSISALRSHTTSKRKKTDWSSCYQVSVLVLWFYREAHLVMDFFEHGLQTKMSLAHAALNSQVFLFLCFKCY